MLTTLQRKCCQYSHPQKQTITISNFKSKHLMKIMSYVCLCVNVHKKTNTYLTYMYKVILD